MLSSFFKDVEINTSFLTLWIVDASMLETLPFNFLIMFGDKHIIITITNDITPIPIFCNRDLFLLIKSFTSISILLHYNTRTIITYLKF